MNATLQSLSQKTMVELVDMRRNADFILMTLELLDSSKRVNLEAKINSKKQELSLINEAIATKQVAMGIEKFNRPF